MHTFIKNMINWNIDCKLFVLPLDNDCVHDVCVRKIKEILQGTLLYIDQFFYMRYVAHIINLVV